MHLLGGFGNADVDDLLHAACVGVMQRAGVQNVQEGLAFGQKVMKLFFVSKQ